ncbi:MAG: hypothetical protein ACRCXZ_03295 [Patescibacteria group bacterium]
MTNEKLKTLESLLKNSLVDMSNIVLDLNGLDSDVQEEYNDIVNKIDSYDYEKLIN